MMSLSAIFGGKFAYQFGNLTRIRLRTKLSGVFSFVLVYHPLVN